MLTAKQYRVLKAQHEQVKAQKDELRRRIDDLTAQIALIRDQMAGLDEDEKIYTETLAAEFRAFDKAHTQ